MEQWVLSATDDPNTQNLDQILVEIEDLDALALHLETMKPSKVFVTAEISSIFALRAKPDVAQTLAQADQTVGQGEQNKQQDDR